MIVSNKRISLLKYIINYDSKKFYSTWPWSLILNSYFFKLKLFSWFMSHATSTDIYFTSQRFGVHKPFLLTSYDQTNWRGRLSTIDLLIKIACLAKKSNNIFNIKGAYLNWFVQGGQLYWSLPFSKSSLPWGFFWTSFRR